MNVIFSSHVNGHSLADEIRRAEEQLRLRRVALHEGLHTVDTAIRRRLTAPDALLWGVGTGFALGEITKKKRSPPSRRSENASAPPDPASHEEQETERPGPIQLALHYWAVARPIIGTAVSILTPYFQAKAEKGGASDAAAEATKDTEAMQVAGETYTTHQHAS